jgi:hypothetical protein
MTLKTQQTTNNVNKTPQTVRTPTKTKQMTKTTQKVKTPLTHKKTQQKVKTPTLNTAKVKATTTTTKRKTPNTKYTNHPDYEYDTIKKRWVKKSDIRPAELVNRYKVFLMDYLKAKTKMDPKRIETLVRKHATSTERLKEILIKEGALSKIRTNIFFNNNSFWKKELCGHMKKVCPTERDLSERDWCEYNENGFFYFNDEKSKHISCFSIKDIYDIISSSFTGGDDDMIFLQLPRDPYTRKVFNEEFIKKFLKQLRHLKGEVNNLPRAHVVYFLRNYKTFYNDPKIKSFLKKNTLTNKEKWELSEAIQKFMTKSNEIGHGFTTKGHKRWWFWVNDEKEPTDLYNYVFNK